MADDKTSPKLQMKPVKVVFHKANEVPIYYAAGGWGLAGQDDELILKFFLEHPATPTVVTFPLKSENEVSDNPDSTVGIDPKYYTVIREFQAGVVLTLKAARQVHGLLQSFIEAHENLSAQKK